MEPDDTLCYCFHITQRKIANYIRRERPPRPSQVSECFGAGTGCGWCIPFLIRLHREIVGGEVIEAAQLSAEEYEELRRKYRRGVADGSRPRNDLRGDHNAAEG